MGHPGRHFYSDYHSWPHPHLVLSILLDNSLCNQLKKSPPHYYQSEMLLIYFGTFLYSTVPIHKYCVL